MKALTVYGINIFQTLIFKFNCKNQAVLLILQNLFTIKPRDKYAKQQQICHWNPFAKENLVN